ncbi:MAG TPA: hypothetical protein VJ689_01700 [Gaiellaceae bacterium]|nr:hypothetical protein [Gaiellaceae bacterium]
MATSRTGELAALVEPRDRAHVEQIADDTLRETVIASLTRHRRADPLLVGDALPALTLHHADGARTARLDELVRGRPLALVFASYT